MTIKGTTPVIYLFQECVPIQTKDGNAKLMRPGVISGVHMCVKLVNELVSLSKQYLPNRTLIVEFIFSDDLQNKYNLFLGKTIKSKCLYSSLVSMSGRHFVDDAYVKKKCKAAKIVPSSLIRTMIGRLG